MENESSFFKTVAFINSERTFMAIFAYAVMNINELCPIRKIHNY